VNVFGTLWVTQAILPISREQGKGHLIQLSSMMGINTLLTMGLYSATKLAVEGFSEALQAEVKDFGIHVTLIEPNSFKTDFFESSSVQSQSIDAYAKVTAYSDPVTESNLRTLVTLMLPLKPYWILWMLKTLHSG
jgi:short-subunit dehydrogenase